MFLKNEKKHSFTHGCPTLPDFARLCPTFKRGHLRILKDFQQIQCLRRFTSRTCQNNQDHSRDPHQKSSLHNFWLNPTQTVQIQVKKTNPVQTKPIQAQIVENNQKPSRTVKRELFLVVLGFPRRCWLFLAFLDLS